jgi:signal transduction histidine kinase
MSGQPIRKTQEDDLLSRGSFEDWQRAFAVGRLRIVGIVGIVTVGSYAVADGLQLGWVSPAVLYRIPSILALAALLVLVKVRRAWILRHVDIPLVVAGCIVAFASVAAVPVPAGESLEESILAFNQGRWGITLLLFALAVMVPARLRVHLVVQIATLAFFAVRMPDVHATLLASGDWAARAMGLLWVCFFADLSVVMFTRLQRSELAARGQLERESAKRGAYLDGLVRIGASATATDPDHQARAVLDELVGLLGAERALLSLAAESGGLVFRAGRDAAGKDVSASEAEAARDAVRVPLRMRDHLVGEIVLERPAGAGALSAADQDFLRTLASHAAIALEALRTSAELRLAHEEALDAGRAKDAFLQTMSHELRTPITTMLGYTEMLGEELSEAGDADHAADAKNAHEAAEGLLSIVTDVLELTHLETERGSVSVTSFPVAELLAELEAEIRPLAESNGNRLEVAVDPRAGSMASDRERVAMILRRLLQNACKFTSHGKVVCEVSHGVEEGDPMVRFRVTDTGIGMTDDQLARCFEPFYQADSSATRTFGGAGLGLTAAERLVHTLHGEIVGRSRPGEGSEFVVTLPASLEPLARR